MEKPERCYLLIKEPEARYLGRQDLMEMSERIEGGSMVRAIQHTEKLFPDGELFAAAARWERSLPPPGPGIMLQQ